MFSQTYPNSARHCLLFTMEDLGASKSVGKNSLSEAVDALSTIQSVDVVAAGSSDAQSGVVCRTTLDGEVVVLNEFLGVPDTHNMSYEDIMNTTGKFFKKKENIVDFVDSKLKETWRVTEKFDKWLEKQDLLHHVKNSAMVVKIFEDVCEMKGGTALYSVSMVKTLFDINDGNKRTNEALENSDLRFLNLMAASSQFDSLKNPDLINYVKEAQCHKESVRIIRKYGSTDIDTDLIAEGWRRQTKRRSLEIAIFISQYFGRAERVMEDCDVKVLWDSLEFMDHLLKIVEVQCKPLQQATIMDSEQNSDDSTSIGRDSELDTCSKTVPLGKPSAPYATMSHSKRKPDTSLTRKKQKKQKPALTLVSSDIMCLSLFLVLRLPF